MWYSLFIPSIILILGGILSWRGSWLDSEAASPYECGFSSFNGSRRSFSLFFFHIAILFLVFDVEVIILMPAPEGSSFHPFCSWAVLGFILILLAGFYHEWREGTFQRPSW